MRRKPVPCAMGCGRDTRSDNGVCPDCLHTYHLGQDAERVEAETSNKALEYIEMPYTLRLWWAERPSDDKHRDLAKKAETDIRRLILAIAGAGRANTYDINNKPVLVNRRQYDYSGGRDTLSVPARRQGSNDRGPRGRDLVVRHLRVDARPQRGRQRFDALGLGRCVCDRVQRLHGAARRPQARSLGGRCVYRY